ncbi:metal ABC transporter permease, partial [Phocaeicola vulgatus]|nr:metal ABC transporter permease [Phocaeicola vulgatus]
CLGGLFISYKLQVPTGAAIIFFSILIYTFCKMGKSMYLCKQKKLNQTNSYGN